MQFLETWFQIVHLKPDALKFFLILCTSYIFAAVEALFLVDTHQIRSSYHAVIAFLLGYVCFNVEIFHCVAIIVIAYLLLYLSEKDFYSRRIALTATFIFVFGYLLIVYVHYGTLDYSADITFPICVLTLKLIGFAFDFYDGGKPPSKSATTNHGFQSKPIHSLPSLISYLGFVGFYPTFFVGPVCSYEEYRIMLKRGVKNTPPRGRLILRLIGLAIVYISMNVFGAFYFPKDRLLDDRFIREHSLIERCVYFWLSYRCIMSKYIGVWLLVEGASVLAGAGYTEKGHHWRGWTNIRPSSFEFGLSLRQVIESFNVRTNAWSKYYIFKRLQFLGSKQLSTVITLAFLAFWHGFWPGYFLAFSYEFLCLYSEQRVLYCIHRLRESKFRTIIENPFSRLFFMSLIWCGRTFTIYYALASLDLLVWPSIYRLYRSLFFIGYLLHIGIILASFVCPRLDIEKSK